MKQITTRSLSFVIALFMVLTMIPTANAYSNVSSWAEAEVTAMEELGLIPSSLDDADLTQSITRLDMCRIAVAAYSNLTDRIIPTPYEHPFADTTDPDAERAFLAGLIKGKDDGKFHPNESLSRKDFFAFVSQFIAAVGCPVSDSDYASLDGFRDAASMPGWVVEHAKLSVGLGIVQGDSNRNLGWDQLTSAEQALLMFYRAYNAASSRELTPPEIETPIPPFENLSDWARESVEKMEQMGLVPSSVKYSSMTGPITRGDMCKIVMLAYKQLTFISDSDLGPVGQSPFKDTSDKDIVNAYRLDIVSGDGNGRFRPDDPITRQEYFKITVNFLNAIGYSYLDDDDMNLNEYPDSNKLSTYAQPCARLLISLGIINGDTNKNLHPRDSIVSQEALVIFYRTHNFVTTWVAPTPDEDDRDEVTQGTANDLVNYAMTFVGGNYIYGGDGPEDGGFDCSGLVKYVYKHFGYNLPRVSRDQWKVSETVISRDDLLPGDLLFFTDNGAPSGISHVAIYIGNNKIVHASTPSTGIIVSDLSEPYYVRKYLGAKRVIN